MQYYLLVPKVAISLIKMDYQRRKKEMMELELIKEFIAEPNKTVLIAVFGLGFVSGFFLRGIKIYINRIYWKLCRNIKKKIGL